MRWNWKLGNVEFGLGDERKKWPSDNVRPSVAGNGTWRTWHAWERKKWMVMTVVAADPTQYIVEGSGGGGAHLSAVNSINHYLLLLTRPSRLPPCRPEAEEQAGPRGACCIPPSGVHVPTSLRHSQT